MKNLYKNLPETPGVYLMKGDKGRLLYVGKAGNLWRRVSSYFLRPHDARIEKLVSEIRKIDYRETDTALEALILEAELIKELRPPFNVREKDDKSFLYVEVTKDEFPRVLLVRGRDADNGARFGPFTYASSVRDALKILRKIFPWSTHPPEKLGKFDRPCFDHEVGLCPGTCVGAITREEYIKSIKNLILLFEGKKKKILGNLQKEMGAASKALEFEKAEKIRRRIFALQHIRDIALINEPEPFAAGPLARSWRIEGYDISNISGTSAVGSMVVFTNGLPDKDEYRKFRIRTVTGANDVGMLKEMLRRRFARLRPGYGGQARAAISGREMAKGQWPLPDLILIDGGSGQVNAAKSVLSDVGIKIPIVGIAKGPKRKRNDFIGILPRGLEKRTLVRVRDEAHRFAIGYHKKVRGKEFLGSPISQQRS